jgi:hypothetical protein
MSSRANAPNRVLARSALHAPHAPRLIDLWDAWLFAEADASCALGDWSCAPDADKSDAYAAYRAALDREEQAARVFERRSRRK